MIDTPKTAEIEFVEIGPRLRVLIPEKVAALAESMNAIGLQHPISIYSPNDETLELVAGLHRLEAARKLGWVDIDCIFVQMDDIDRKLWEIDENLCRADLSPAELAQHLKRREGLWKERQQQEVSGQVDPKPQGGRPTGFAKDTEEKTGTPKRTTNRALSRAKAIPADVFGKIEGTDLDTGIYLDALKKLTHEEQHNKVARDLDTIEQHKNDARLKEEEGERKRQAFNDLVEEAKKAGDLKDEPVLHDIKWDFRRTELPDQIVSLNIDAKGLALLFNACWEFAGKPTSQYPAHEKWWEPIGPILDLIESEGTTVEDAVRQITTAIQEKKDREKAEREEEERQETEKQEREWQEREPFEHFAELLLGNAPGLGAYEQIEIYNRVIRHLKNCKLTKLATAVEKMKAEWDAEDEQISA